MTLSPAQQTQLLSPAILRLMQALHNANGEARIVGGAVRDAILGRKLGDVDLATTLPPEQVMEILTQHNLKTVPTGLAHGTITAVVDHIGYEITTLRRDVATDGRHAQVAFTDDWRADAARRDFTFNALYVDANGTLYDYFDGIADARAGRVRFIGDANARIQEDVLRILRFFRFTAAFGRGAPDADALTACRERANTIPRLSVERIAREIIKLLATANPAPAWQVMQDCGVTQHFLAEANDLARLQTLLLTEKTAGETTAPLTRLAALLPQDEAIAATVAVRLKLARRDAETLTLLAKLPALLNAPLRPLLYAYGIAACKAALLLNGTNIASGLAQIATWENPTFPLKGQDLVQQGIPPSPRIGDILRQVENWWIASDFQAGRDACLAQAKTYAQTPQ